MMVQPQTITMRRDMSEEEIAAASELARRTLGRRLAGPWPPPEDHPGDLLLALARTTLMLCRHIEAVENVPRTKKPAAHDGLEH